MAKNTSYKIFREKYITHLPEDFKWQNTPVQIYPLERLYQYLLIPTPLLQSDYYHIIFLNRGSFIQQIDTEIYEVKSPSVIYIPENTIYSLKEIKGQLTGFLILIENKAISSVLSQLNLSDLLSVEKVIKLNEKNNYWLNEVCSLLYGEIETKAPNRNIALGLLQAILHKVIDLSSITSKISRQRELANSYKILVNKHFVEHKSVDFYAKKLSISENYLNRCVRSEFNKSCKQLIQQTAIQKSQIIMFGSKKDISEICFEIGFTDPSYFSRIFKKVTGKTPTQFQKQIMHGLS